MQMTRHSNTMVFGTATSVGLKVGQNANQVPEVVVGYDRQEAVIMPLLANTRERNGDQYLLTPCEALAQRTTIDEGSRVTITETMQMGDMTGTEPKAMLHPCKFVGLRASDHGATIQDSYSVLASFGAQIEGNASTTKGSVGLAQYFATGVAAQILAATGGAAVVSVGAGAEESAKSGDKSNAVAAALGADAYPSDGGTINQNVRTALLAKLATLDDPNVQARMPAYIDKLNLSDRQKTSFKAACATKDGCINFIETNPQLIEGSRTSDVDAI